MTYEFPDDLLKAQRDFYAADARARKLSDAWPLSAAVLAGEAEPPTDGQRDELAAARAEALRLIQILYGHPWFETVGDNPKEARLALQKAAAKP